MPAITRFVAYIALVFLAAGAAGAARAEKPEVFSANGAAIGGYDAVAYFTEKKPVKGNPQFSVEWKGAVWHFASAANRDAFKAAPANYAPQYGGYCAYGAAQGLAVAVDPLQWRVVDGKLYLNVNKNVQDRWLKDIPGYIEAANKNWPDILKK
jgi:YHS domain-containing protein